MSSERIMLMIAALALAGPAPAARDRAAERAAESARVAALPETGPARRCLQLRQVQEVRLVDETTLLVREGLSHWFRVTLPAPCPAIAPNRFVTWKSPIGPVCAGDPFDVVDPIGRISYGFCTLGEFQPVDNGHRPAR